MNIIENTIFWETKNNQNKLNKIKIIISIILLIFFSLFSFFTFSITIYYFIIFLFFYIFILFLWRIVFNNYFSYYKYINTTIDIIWVSLLVLIMIKYTENIVISVYFIPFLMLILSISSLWFQKFYTIVFWLYSLFLSIYLLYIDNLLDGYSIIIIFLFILNYINAIYNSSNLKQIIYKISHLQELEKFTNSNLLQKIKNNPDILDQNWEKKELVIFFLDIRWFSIISENFTSNQIFKILNLYLWSFSNIIEKNNGTVDKYIWDCIMWYFEWDNKILNSYNSSMEILKELSVLNINNWFKIKIGIGMHFWEVFSWSIWNKNRMDYTIIWDNVNITSRLESLNKELFSNIVVSKSYFDNIDFQTNFKFQWNQKLKWKNNSIDVYTL